MRRNVYSCAVLAGHRSDRNLLLAVKIMRTRGIASILSIYLVFIHARFCIMRTSPPARQMTDLQP